MNSHGDGDGAGAGTGTGEEVNEGAQGGNRDGSGDGAGTGTGVETRRRTPDGDGDGDGSKDSSGDGKGDEDRIGEGGREAKKRKKLQNSCRRQMGYGGETWVERGKHVEEKGVDPALANPDNLESNKETDGGPQGTQGSNKTCTSRESVSPLSRLIRGFRKL